MILIYASNLWYRSSVEISNAMVSMGYDARAFAYGNLNGRYYANGEELFYKADAIILMSTQNEKRIAEKIQKRHERGGYSILWALEASPVDYIVPEETKEILDSKYNIIKAHIDCHNRIFLCESTSRKFLEDKGHKIDGILPYCYTSNFKDYGWKRKYDIGFVGAHSSRRDLFLENFAPEKKYKALIAHKTTANPLIKILNQVKIGLNILAIDSPYTAKRVSETMVCGAMCLSEPFTDAEKIFSPDEIVLAELSKFEETINYYLAHDKERREIVKRGHDRIIKEHSPMKKAEFFIDILKKDGMLSKANRGK